MVFILNKLTQSLASHASAREKARMRRQAREKRLSNTSHNQMDLKRDTARLSQSRGGIAHSNNHQPVGHMRLQGHMDNKVAGKGRGGDSRTRISNNVSVARRMRDNDPINIDRPLG